jgi:hypothetical protein
MAVTIGPGWSIGAGWTLGTGGGSPDPATGTGGINLAVIAGLPQSLYPGVSLYSGVGATDPTQFIVNPTSTYGTPAGFTFLSSWIWSQYDPDYITRSTTYTANDTITPTSLGNQCNNGALGSVVIAPSSKVMFSVLHSLYSGADGYDAVGVGSATTNYTGPNQAYLGGDNQAVAIYDNGGVYSNDAWVGSGYTVFQTNGQIIDVAVDTVNNKMWYRVAGGAWQG